MGLNSLRLHLLLFRDTLVPKPLDEQRGVSGKAEPVVSDHCCGDNYVAKANACYDPDVTEFDCKGRLVAWKRVYLEIDRMYGLIPPKRTLC